MYASILNETIEGKTILVRVDVNANFQGGKLQESDRFLAHGNALRQLSGKGARLVVLAHQGRKGGEDFFPLVQHAQLLEKYAGQEIKVVSWDSDYAAQVRSLRNGEIILMDNVRIFDEESNEKPPEEHASVPFVQSLSKLADCFVLDAFSVAHRSHTSVVGFTATLPSFAGPTLVRELEALSKITSVSEGRILILGGAKPKDMLELMQYFLSEHKADLILAGGLAGELLLKAKGISFGQKDYFLKEKGFFDLLPLAKELLSRFSKQIILPVDLAVPDSSKKRKSVSLSALPVSAPTLDIGNKTIALFIRFIKPAKLILVNGTVGVFEQKGFEVGTKKILSAVARNKAFSLIGGGDTLTALHQLGFAFDRFGHVSLAGKALLEYLSGQKLPGLVALEQNAARFSSTWN